MRFGQALLYGFVFSLVTFENQIQSSTVGAANPPVPPPASSQEGRSAKPVEPKSLTGEASLPKAQRIGFALDVGGIRLPGNWDVKGKVVGIENQILTFRTTTGEMGNLAYRLPPGNELTLKPGQDIAIHRTQSIQGASLAYNVKITSGSSTVMAAIREYHDQVPKRSAAGSRLFGAQHAALNAGTFDIAESKKVLARETKYATIYSVPVDISFPSSVRTTANTLMAGQSGAQLSLNHEEAYSLYVTDSREVVPREHFKGALEGKGYTLEYVAVKKPN